MLSRVTGFARIAAIAYALGATTLAGTYSYANEAPNIVYELLLGGVLTATLVPLFVQYHETHDDDAPSAIFTVAILALAGITVAGILAAPWIVDLYTLNVKGANLAEQQALATDLLRLFMPQMLFYGIVTLATAMLNARRHFLAAAFAPILNNVVVIAVFLALPRIADGSLTVHNVLDDDALLLLIGLGTTAGVVVMALALVPPLMRVHPHLHFRPRWSHPAVQTMLRLSGWTVGYVIANQIALLVVTILANGTDGGPFIYISAYAFFQLPHGLFAVSLMTTFTPEMAVASTRGDLVALRTQLSRGIRLAALVIVPAAAMYIALARPIIVALLQRGAFDAADASAVSDTLVAFSVGLLPFSIYLFAMRAFYAAPRHVHAVLDQLCRERREHRARVPAVRLAGDPRPRARVCARVLRRRGNHPCGAPRPPRWHRRRADGVVAHAHRCGRRRGGRRELGRRRADRVVQLRPCRARGRRRRGDQRRGVPPPAGRAARRGAVGGARPRAGPAASAPVKRATIRASTNDGDRRQERNA